MQEIERRIGFLSWCWETSNRSLIALGQHCTEIEKRKAKDEAERSFAENIAAMGDVEEDEKQRIWNTFHKPQLNMRTDFSQIIIDYFNKVQIYREKVLPQLSVLIKDHHTFIERFNFKSITIIAFKVIAFVFVFGVLVPMLLLGLENDLNLEWHAALPYFLLVLTISPYAYIWKRLLNKVNGLNNG